MSNVDAVIFDLDGTLTDTEKYYQIAWPQAVEQFGYKMESWQPLELRSLGRPFAPLKFKEWYGEDFDYQLIRDARKKIMEDIIEENGIPLKPNCIETLTFLRKHGILVAMATANDYERTKGYLNKIGLFDYFDKIICANMVEKGKPAPDIYAYACTELGVDPNRAIAVEDSPNGVCSAYGAGCRVVMVPDLTEPDEELSKMLFARCDTLLDICSLV